MCPPIPDVHAALPGRGQQPAQGMHPALPAPVAGRVQDAAALHTQVVQRTVAQGTKLRFGPPTGQRYGQSPEQPAYRPAQGAPAQGLGPAHVLPDVCPACVGCDAIHTRHARPARYLDTDAEKQVLLGYSFAQGPTVPVAIRTACTPAASGPGPTLA